MRVLMLAPEPFLEPRGTPLSVYQRLRALSALGYEVDLVTYHAGQAVELPGLRIHRIPAIRFFREVPVGPSWMKPVLDLFLLAVALLQLLRRRFDVIHSHEEAAFIAVLLSFLFRTPHIYDMHSSLPRQLSNFNFGNWPFLVKTFEFFERVVISTCDAVITIGSDLEALARSINPNVPIITIENIPVATGNGEKATVTLNELKQKVARQGSLLVVYTGTFEAYQGLDLLLESARIVVDTEPNARFLLVGGKTHQIEHWRAVADQLRLADCVEFVGMVPLDEAVLYLELADVLVSPRTGGTSVPLKIYSYLYAGKATVATRLIAHTTVLTDQTACLVEPTGEAFAEGILLLLGNAQLRAELGVAGRAFAEEKYSFNAYKEKVRYAYQALAGSARKVADSTAVVGD